MRILKLTIAYDGTHFCGWQRQHNGPSIQQELERAASVICNHPITVHGAGRTDAGVHAVGMTAHFTTISCLSCHRMTKGLNALLPAAIRIMSVDEEVSAFHARFSALAKTYRYTFSTGKVLCPLDRLYTATFPYSISESALSTGLQIITGTHDFSSFETAGSRDKNLVTGRGAVRTIFRAELETAKADFFHISITGDGFLRHMVRNIVGTLLEVGRGKRSLQEFNKLLEYRDRNLAGPTAPAHGLTLLRVHYQHDWD